MTPYKQKENQVMLTKRLIVLYTHLLLCALLFLVANACTTSSYISSESAETRHLRKLILENPDVSELRMLLLIDGGLDPLEENKEGEALLFHVAKNIKNYDAFVTLIEESNVDLLLADDVEYNVFHYSARHNPHLEFIQSLDKGFPDEPKIAPGNNSPAHLAAQGNSIEIIDYFISQGYSLNATNDLQETPLHTAIRNAQPLEVVEFLEEKGADPNAQDINNNSILHFAAQSDSSELVNYALTKDIDPTMENNDGQTALEVAARESKSPDFLRHLFTIVNYVAPDQQNDVEREILQDRFGPEVANTILEPDEQLLGIYREISLARNINAQSENGDTPPVITAEASDTVASVPPPDLDIDQLGTDSEEILANSGEENTSAEPDDTFESYPIGLAQLYAYFVSGRLQTLRLPEELNALLDQIPYETVSFNDTPLIFYAIRNNDMRALEILTERGASLLDRNYYGETVLHWAAMYSDDLELVTFLLERVPELLYEPEYLVENLPAHYAAEFAPLPIFLALEQAGETINEPNALGQTPRLLLQRNRNAFNAVSIWNY